MNDFDVALIAEAVVITKKKIDNGGLTTVNEINEFLKQATVCHDGIPYLTLDS